MARPDSVNEQVVGVVGQRRHQGGVARSMPAGPKRVVERGVADHRGEVDARHPIEVGVDHDGGAGPMAEVVGDGAADPAPTRTPRRVL